ncbi:hypothetical protein [Mangrovihabitans endophyticus]|uniref:hypothetical protein n=1 Tax=Mangrovihabitans endophyticus TaxID=1751298 RepID=UPI00166D15D7|nr:hypothetical protein [Mangrovihabitans endophyticus]
MDLNTERFQEPAQSLRWKGVEINFELRKMFEQVGILFGLRRGGGSKPFELRLDSGEFPAQLFYLLLDALDKVSVGVTRAPQRDCEVCHIAVDFGQLLPEGRRRFEMFITDEAACGGQAGLGEREPFRSEDVAVEEQRDALDKLVFADPDRRWVVFGQGPVPGLTVGVGRAVSSRVTMHSALTGRAPDVGT